MRGVRFRLLPLLFLISSPLTSIVARGSGFQCVEYRRNPLKHLLPPFQTASSIRASNTRCGTGPTDSVARSAATSPISVTSNPLRPGAYFNIPGSQIMEIGVEFEIQRTPLASKECSCGCIRRGFDQEGRTRVRALLRWSVSR